MISAAHLNFNKMAASEIESIASTSIESESSELLDFVKELIEYPENKSKPLNYDNISRVLKRKYQLSPSKKDIYRTYTNHFSSTKITVKMRKWMIKSQVRSNSGVLVVTIVLAPNKFSCKYDCAYCPQETDLEGNPTQPRSYLSNEPAMLRALQSDFDVKGQFNNRINSYKLTGNIGNEQDSKIEVIFSGGTWESYPIDYREQVIRELYWAANTVKNERPSKTLEEEININETANFRIIGFTLETRPDNITKETILQYRKWGVTRIQIGVQHYDDAILKEVNRKCYTKDTINAIRLLKQAGFKVVVHLMPDLPGSSPEQDKWMFDQAINRPELQFDDIKIYPTAVVQTFDDKHIVKSKILDMYKDGSFTPYSEKNVNDLIDVCIYYKTRLNPWVRIQRLIRDIPGTDIAAGYNKMSNLRQIIHNKIAKEGLKCYCIRCMEIGDKEYDNYVPMVAVRKYEASEGTEYHISVEAHKMNLIDIIDYWIMLGYMYFFTLFTGRSCYWSGNLDTYIGLYGFLRLRIDPQPGGDFIPEINDCALVREVHVYGTSMGVGAEANGSQHRGYGKLLMKTAETIVRQAGWNKIAVIAGVGTREYYKNKCGYRLEGTYMVKDLEKVV
jgi:ELP3 family radical SAM enzyme/protein acetyltransferase